MTPFIQSISPRLSVTFDGYYLGLREDMGKTAPVDYIPFERDQAVKIIQAILPTLTNEQRMSVIEGMCHYCGRMEPGCQCANDE